MPTLLEQAIEELRKNDRQWDAFQTQGNCVVIAPPGSGKTKLLTTRMAVDLQTHVAPPQGTACITLTVAAAMELKDRLRRLGGETRPASFIGTLHSFALNRILRPFAQVSGRHDLSNVRIATTNEQRAAYESARDANFPQVADDGSLKSTIDVARRRFFTGEQWRALGPGVRQTALDYKANLRTKGLIDFDGVVEEAVHILETSLELRQVLQARFPRVYVDEYQDLPPGLDRLVRLLCFEGDQPSQLFAVGDPDQAIFGFLGTQPELLYQLARMETVSCIRLEKNYRSGKEIIRLASQIKESSMPTVGTRVGGTVTVSKCENGYPEQLEEIANRVELHQSNRVPLEQISVICATNLQCEEVANILALHNIPAFYRTSEYRLTTTTSFIEKCTAWCFLGREQSGNRLAALLEAWRSIRGERNRDLNTEVPIVATLLQLEAVDGIQASEFISLLLDNGLREVLAQAFNGEERGEVQRMFDAYDNGLEENDVLRLSHRAKSDGRVEVTTMNSSKGLEFDRVLIPGLDGDRFPSYYAQKDAEQMAEERRKFYVSLTRARESVELFYSGFVERSWGNKYAGPSVFLRDLGLVE